LVTILIALIQNRPNSLCLAEYRSYLAWSYFIFRTDEGGVFVCKAKGFERVPGGRMSAVVKVLAKPFSKNKS
jgi:hypothetical protein